MTAIQLPDLAPPEADPVPDRAAEYEARAAGHGVARAAAARGVRAIGWARLLVFVALVLSAIQWGTGAAPRAAWVGAVLAGLVVFGSLVARHRRFRETEARHARLELVCRRGAARVRRAWDALPPSDVAADPSHPFAADLDVLGPRASLLALLDVTSTAPGRPTLRAWLLDPPPAASTVRARQDAVRELAARTELREELAAQALAAGPLTAAELDRFGRWAEGAPWLLARPALRWAARLLPLLFLLAVALRIGPGIGGRLWVLPFGAGIALTLWARRALGAGIRDAEARATGLRGQSAMLARLGVESFAAPALRALQARIHAGGDAAHALARLERLVALGEVRYSGMTYAVAQLVLLWDFHVLDRLERWRGASGKHVRDWLAALGEAESLAALATLAHDNPRWTFPELVDEPTSASATVVAATSLGHPLIAESARVANDVTVGPPGTVLLVTGSNMSGKSTLLRAVGLNVVLARAGAPVCAASMRLPLLDVHTSMRVQDSLVDGLSFFMAELRRLASVVDAARAPDRTRPLLYLLDEILQGTNTAERQVAARTIVSHLLAAPAIGMVTTHDLALADDDGPLAQAAVPVHFSETFADGAMTFDYRLRPGIATSTNALQLLRMVGLG